MKTLETLDGIQLYFIPLLVLSYDIEIFFCPSAQSVSFQLQLLHVSSISKWLLPVHKCLMINFLLQFYTCQHFPGILVEVKVAAYMTSHQSQKEKSRKQRSVKRHKSTGASEKHIIYFRLQFITTRWRWRQSSFYTLHKSALYN